LPACRIFSSASRSVGTPIQLTSVPKVSAAANAVNMAVGQSRDDGAAAEVDQPGLVARELPHRRIAARRQHLAVADRERLSHRKIAVDGEDLAVEQHGVGGLGEGRARG